MGEGIDARSREEQNRESRLELHVRTVRSIAMPRCAYFDCW